MPSLLDGISPDMIRLHPFPHLLIEDALPADLYRAVSAAYPTLDMIVPPRHGGRPYPSNSRYAFSAWVTKIHDQLAPVWKAFIRRHSDAAFLAQVVRLFDGHWPAALVDHLDGDILGHETGLLLQPHPTPPRIFLDARAEVNTPTFGAPSVSRGPHLDTPNRLYSGLFYCRADDDDSVGGDLILYRWKNGPVQDFDAFQLPPEAVEEAVTIPYRPNQLVLFPQGINALHGVGLRHPTPHVRRYVFLTAELGTPWLTLPDEAA